MNRVFSKGLASDLVNPLATVLVAIALALLLAGCSWMRIPWVGGHDGMPDHNYKKGSIGEFIAELPPVTVPDAVATRPTREEVMGAYRRVYGVMPNAVENHAVGKRLADLEMEYGVELDLEGEQQPYRAAISLYEELLLSGTAEGRDEIYYQLARAHDVVGNTESAEHYLDQLIGEHPDSRYIGEVRFRRAEMRFSRGQYRDAASDYQFVVSIGDATPYERNSTYMLGWSRFKLGDLDAGLQNFFAVVQQTLTDHGSDSSLEGLPAVEQDLVGDTLRVTVLALGYLDGAETLAQQMTAIGKPDWQFHVYDRLAIEFREQERFLDSVNTFQAFIDHNPMDDRAPQFHVRMIETLGAGNFPSSIRPKKEEFVARYGVRSEYWSRHDGEARAAYMATLKSYLAELSMLAHAEAQTRENKSDYLKAADWYEQIVATFPEDPSVAEYMFLLGEVYTEAGEHGRAVAAYQRVVHDFPDDNRANEAGYAAILGLQALVATAPADELELWQRLKIDAQIEFAMFFPDDPRAVAAQAGAADALFELDAYSEAVELAQHLVSTHTDLEPRIQETALLILGHGHFELGDFVAAESAYQRLLAMRRIKDRRAIEESLLATVYKQGEAAEQAGDAQAAVAHFLRLSDLGPGSEMAVKGHFDAIAVMESGAAWRDAAVLLEQFRANYPRHELARDVSKRLATLYERTEDWHHAARELETMSRSDADVEVRRQSLYRSAELYLQVDDLPRAIELFRTYANTYLEPADLRMEAIHHMDVLYQRTADPDKRRFWLRKKIELHASMGQGAPQRTTYLAAEAEYVLAMDERARFEAVRLKRPLKTSLKKKTASLKKAVGAFERVASYQVGEFATAATFQIADIYASLSLAIYKSDRPAKLSELELEQYEILLEEQAFPFEEQAISLHEINMRRCWDGVYDDWVKRSFAKLSGLMPARFDKHEVQAAYVEAIF